MPTQQKIPVAILGATGSVGQKFVELLADHPWFEIVALCASERSAGKSYKEAAGWFQTSPLPEHIGNMNVRSCKPLSDIKIAFSGLDASVAGEIETAFAKAGIIVVSNSKNHRMDKDVPLLIPEVNPESLSLIERQTVSGAIVTNPNCSTVGLCLALKPLLDVFGIDAVSVVTLQALSGAGYPGVSSLDILDNVIPFIGGEEEKMQLEPRKILGNDMPISAQCNRVAVFDGHLECVNVRLSRPAHIQEIIRTWETFSALPQTLKLPSAPIQPIVYHTEEAFPQPRRHRMLGEGMTVSIGRLRPCPIMGWKFVVLSHNTIRGAAGGAILNAELMVRQGIRGLNI